MPQAGGEVRGAGEARRDYRGGHIGPDRHPAGRSECRRIPEELARGRWVVKSLTQTPIGKSKVFFVKEVDPNALDLSYPWFLQKHIDGEEEVAVVYIDGQTCAANAPRDSFDGEDSRMSGFIKPGAWLRCELSPAEERAINGFMDESRRHQARRP